VQWTITNGTIITSNYSNVYFTTDPGGQPATITAVATDNLGCTSSASHTFGIRAIPPPVIGSNFISVCPGSPVEAVLQPPADALTSWQTIQWSVANGTLLDQGGTMVHFTSDPGGQPATLTAVATDSLGCTSAASHTFGVRTIAPAVIGSYYTSVCPGSPVEAVLQPPADALTSWQTIQWSVANGTLLDQVGTYVHFTSDPGGQPATLTVTATDNLGCTATGAKTFDVAAPPAVVLTSDRPTLCANTTAQVHAASSADISRIVWTVTHGSISGPTDAADVAVVADGSGDVQLTFTAFADGVCAVRSTLTLPLAAPPDATISAPASTCAGGTFAASAPDAGPGATYTWTATGATLSSANGSSATFLAGGAGTIDLSVTINANGCSNSGTRSLTAGAPPTPAITPDGQTTFCAGGHVALIAPAGYSAYGWSTGATTRTILATAGGSYTVTVTDANGCSASSTPFIVTVRDNPPTPVIAASGPTAFCAGGSVVLTAPAGYLYLWSTNDTTQSITASTSGSYSVTVIDSHGCRSTSAPTAVAANANPANPFVTASGPTNFCAGGSVTLTAPAGYSYAWSNGATTQSIAVSAAGSYSVTITDANGCSAASFATDVFVRPLPAATIDTFGATTFCAGGSVTLSAPANLLYSWSTGATTRTITVTASGSYTVTTSNGNCSATSVPTVVTVTPNPPKPTITAGGPTTFCSGGSVTLTSSPAASYQWSNGLNTQSVTVTLSGNYRVAVYDASGCGTVSDPFAVTVNPLPARPTVTVSGGPCEGGPPLVFTSSPAAAYLWSTGATTQSISFNQAGTYAPTVTITDANGCQRTSDPLTYSISARPPSTITAYGPTTFCAPGSVNLGIPDLSGRTDGPFTIHWSTGETANIISASHGGTYSLTVTNAHGCTSTSSIVVNAVDPPKPTIAANGPTQLCTTSGQTVTLRASDGFASYHWFTGETTQSITVNRGGTYYVVGTTPEGCQKTSDGFGVTEDAVVILPSGPTTFCQGNVTLTAQGNAASYSWSTGATTTSITVANSGTYSVTATFPDGCTVTRSQTVASSADLSVSATPAQPINDPTLYICPGPPMRYTAEVSGGRPPYSYQWYRGDTQLLAGQTGSTFDTTEQNTLFSVVVTDAGGCSLRSNFTRRFAYTNDTVTVTSSGPTTVCGTSAALSAGFATTTPGVVPVSYLWTNGATTSNVTVTESGSYGVTVVDNVGCSTVGAPLAITIYPPAAATVTAGGPTTFCAGGSVTLTASPGVSYGWTNGATTQSIMVSSAGAYRVGVTDANGCMAMSAYTTVTVNPLPMPTITAGGPTTFCAGGSVTLTASSGASYAWSNGATTQSTTVNASGSYSVTVTNANGCNATSAATAVTVNPRPPTPTITAGGPTTFCAGGSVTLTAPSGYTYVWSTGATTQSIVANATGQVNVTVRDANGCAATSAAFALTVNPNPPIPTVTANGPTTFCAGGSVTLTAPSGYTYAWSTGATTQSINVSSAGSYSVTATDANGCAATSAATAVSVNPNPPTPTITAGGPTTFCAGGSVTLTSSAASSYAWSTGATTQSITVNASGSYSVTVTNANSCSATSAATTVTVNPLPTPTIAAGGPTTFCAGGSVTLTSSAASSYTWSNGATTQSITVNASGSYSVTVTNANGCTATSAATAVTVNPLPTPTITAGGPTTFCAGGSVTLTASSASSYAWSTGATTQSITVNASGSYSVTVTNANGCTATSAATAVTVNPLPTPTITAGGPTTFCAGGSVTLTASSASSYAWSNGTTTQSITVNASGSYSVTATNADGCTATSAATTVTVNPLPTPTITAGGPTTFCAGGSVTLTASSASSYAWSTGATTQSITVNASGSYSVTATNANGCTATSAATTVTVNPLPTPTITAGGPTTFCAGGSVTLTASSASSYAWSNGATTQSITVNASGSYSVTVTNANGCTATSAATTVTVNGNPPTPTITAGGPTTFCAGGSVTLTAPGGYTYAWSNGATTQAISATGSGAYSVTVTNANGCSATSAATPVTVNPPPPATITAGGPTSFCVGGSVTLTAPSGYTYTWSNGATTQSITVSSSGSFTLTVRDANGCTATSAATVVAVNANPPTPTITAGGPTTFCNGGSVTLTAPSGYTYSWSTGATTQAITASSSGSYSVTVRDANGCSATSAATIVTENPTITAFGPLTQTVARNATPQNITVTATGPTLKYQWYKGTSGNTAQKAGSTTNTWKPPTGSSGTFTYWVRVTSGTCTADSPTATVTVN
jgi:hypothetical protein